MRWIPAVVAALVLGAAFGAGACDEATPHGVQFALSCAMSLEKGVEAAVPVAVLREIAAQESMEAVRFHSGEKDSRLQADFVFEDLDSFAGWYDSDAAKRLMSTLRKASVRPIEMKLVAHETHDSDDDHDDDDGEDDDRDEHGHDHD